MDTSNDIASIGWDLVVGRRTLHGVGRGLALDIHRDYSVQFYAITAEQEATDSGGSFGAWIGGDDNFTTSPLIVLETDLPEDAPMTNARGEQIAEWCEMASTIGSKFLRPVLYSWGDPEAEGRLAAELATLDVSDDLRRATATVVAILREAVSVALNSEVTR